MTTRDDYAGMMTPQQARRLFQNNPDLLDVAVLLFVDLFSYGTTPQEQAKANKSLEMMESLGILKFPAEAGGRPSLESVRDLLKCVLFNVPTANQAKEPLIRGILNRLKFKHEKEKE